MRSRADAQGPGALIVAEYTKIKAGFLDAIAGMTALSDDVAVSRRLLAYMAFLSAKEQSGQERAQSAAVFAGNGFAAGQFAIVAGQHAYLTTFQRSAGADVLAQWRRVQADPSFARVAELERLALGGAESGLGVTSATWFDAATAKIDALKELEDFQTAAIQAEAQRQRDAAQRGVIGWVSITVLLLLTVAALALAAFAAITRPLREITEVAERMAVGDVSEEVRYDPPPTSPRGSTRSRTGPEPRSRPSRRSARWSPGSARSRPRSPVR